MSSYITDSGIPVWMWRKGQRVRFFTADGVQVGSEHSNVAPAILSAAARGLDRSGLADVVNQEFTASLQRKATFLHINWNGKRDYECTNVVACRAETAPNANWTPCQESDLPALMTKLEIVAGVEYWGYL